MIKKNIIFDTDIGVDCDDACALALLINLAKKGYCDCDTITTSSTRIGAVSTVRAICDYYDYHDYQIGKMSKPAIDADKINSYALEVFNTFRKSDKAKLSAVSLIRKKLTNSKDHDITLVCVGPLSNLGRLMKSKADKYSPLTGKELVAKKVKEAYLMAGVFKEQTGLENLINNQQCPYEWNICQDIDNAIIGVSGLECNVYFLPGEIGLKVETGITTKSDVNSPVWKSIVSFGKSGGFIDKGLADDQVSYQRFSWDPLTVLSAILPENDYLDYSKPGKATVNKDGSTSFEYNPNGKHYVIKFKDKEDIYLKTQNFINENIKK